MNEFDHIWKRLTALARRAPDASTDATTPPGFATRVVAHWFDAESRTILGFSWERLAVRALGVAVVLMMLAVALGWPVVNERAHSEELVALAEPWAVGDSVP